MTLEQSLVKRAPTGVSESDCPGAFRAIVAKPATGRKARVVYIGKNDHPSVADAARANLTEWVAIVDGTWAPENTEHPIQHFATLLEQSES